jgi:hypothetical protein
MYLREGMMHEKWWRGVELRKHQHLSPLMEHEKWPKTILSIYKGASKDYCYDLKKDGLVFCGINKEFKLSSPTNKIWKFYKTPFT